MGGTPNASNLPAAAATVGRRRRPAGRRRPGRCDDDGLGRPCSACAPVPAAVQTVRLSVPTEMAWPPFDQPRDVAVPTGWTVRVSAGRELGCSTATQTRKTGPGVRGTVLRYEQPPFVRDVQLNAGSTTLD